MHSQDQAATLVDTFLATPFSHDPRHARRLRIVAEFEVSTGRPPRSPALGLTRLTTTGPA